MCAGPPPSSITVTRPRLCAAAAASRFSDTRDDVEYGVENWTSAPPAGNRSRPTWRGGIRSGSMAIVRRRLRVEADRTPPATAAHPPTSTSHSITLTRWPPAPAQKRRGVTNWLRVCRGAASGSDPDLGAAVGGTGEDGLDLLGLD